MGYEHLTWEIDPSRLDETRRWLDQIQGQWNEALTRLKASLERPGGECQDTRDQQPTR
jgi:hypothetical protein